MLLMVSKGIRGEMCPAIHRYTIATNKYMKNYDKNKDLSYLMYLDASNLYGGAMSQNCLSVNLNGLKIHQVLIKSLINL